MKEPYYTNEERKAPLSFWGRYFSFKTCVDLSEGVQITPHKGNPGKDALAQDVAGFMATWTINHHPRMNGFPGTSAIKFTVIET